MSYEMLKVQEERGIVTITLNRPEKLNALSTQALSELRAAVEAAATDGGRAIVLEGEGRSFCAGYDLGESSSEPANVQAIREQYEDENGALWAIWNSPLPTVAAVQGHCLGLGCDVAMACDITIASSDAQFGEPEIRHQAFPAFLVLPWVIGMKKTKELLLTGDRISADDALAAGLVNHVVAPDELASAAREMGLKIAKLPPESVRLCKEGINRSYDIRGFANAMHSSKEIAALFLLLESPEAQEFFRISERDGLKAALKWRDSRFED